MIVLVAAVLAVVVSYGMLRTYLHSDKFRKFLSAEASEAAGVVGEFAPFRWDGLAVDTESFEASGEGLVTQVRARGLHTEVGMGGLRRGVWEIRGSSVRQLEVSLDAARVTDQEVKAEVERQVDKKSKRPAWLPSEAEVQGIEIRDLSINANLKQGLVTAAGMHVTAQQAGAKDSYRAEIAGGKLRVPFSKIPELRLDQALVRYQDGRVFLTSAKLGAWDTGRIEGSGELDVKSRQFTAEGEATGLKCEDVLGENWAKRLTGDVHLNFTADNSAGFPAAKGMFEISNGVLTALPVLDALAVYADTRRFRNLALSEARTDWQWRRGEVSLTNLVLASEGLVRIEGNIVIRGQEIDGTFRLGLAPGTLATIPGAETDVFVPGERGLLWAPLRVTGTLDNPEEDLTGRMITAAGIRMLENFPESSEKVLEIAESLLGGSSSKTMDEGIKILEDRSETVREVTGILEGILGARKRKEPEPETEQ